MSAPPDDEDYDEEDEKVQIHLLARHADILTRMAWDAFRNPATPDDDKRELRLILDVLDRLP